METTIEKQIKERVEEYGLSVEMLTAKEIDKVAQEIEAINKGKLILDSVLDDIEIRKRSWMKSK